MSHVKEYANHDYLKVYRKQGRALGSGAFSDVHRVVRNDTNMEYAAKIIKRNQPLPGSRSKELMFDVEIRINKKLNHEHIVNLHEVYRAPTLVLIFDLVTGGELFDDIEKRQCYSEEDAAQCISQVLLGVQYMHNQRIIHRDLKPENLLLTDDKTIKIADFGLAVEFKTDDELIFGTAGSPDYIAPEIINKHYYNKKVDIWSTGVILYILLCGYPPFESLADQKCGAFKFYAEDWQDIDVEARTLIVRMLTVNQKQRIDASQALNSVWLVEHEKRSKEHRPQFIKRIKQFNAKRKFKGGVKAVIATNRMKNLVPDRNSSATSSTGSANNTAAAETVHQNGSSTTPTYQDAPSPTSTKKSSKSPQSSQSNPGKEKNKIKCRQQ